MQYHNVYQGKEYNQNFKILFLTQRLNMIEAYGHSSPPELQEGRIKNGTSSWLRMNHNKVKVKLLVSTKKKIRDAYPFIGLAQHKRKYLRCVNVCHIRK